MTELAALAAIAGALISLINLSTADAAEKAKVITDLQTQLNNLPPPPKFIERRKGK